MPSNNSGIGGMGSEVCPTEDTILALLELLKEPVLTGGKTPSPAQEAYVAKQVQAVVLLYNYHHRKLKPELEFLDFVSFCKLAVVFRPSLLRYMKLMRRDDYAELVDLRKEFSLLEKMVMEACDVCKGLDTPEDIVAGRHISKVAVFLVDHMKENCFLLKSTYTLGIWSVIEREYNLGAEHEATSEEKPVAKKKRITKKPLKGSRSLDESALQQLAFVAVKDACGCSRSDLEVLESHNVYSPSKEKTAARFFIIQSKEASNGSSYIPIRDVINSFILSLAIFKKDKSTAENNTLLLKRSQRELYRALTLRGTVEAVSPNITIRARYHEICCSLQGPLVKKEAHRWVTTSVVQHFHLLPYADIISSWFSRKETCTRSNGAKSHVQGLMQQNHEEPPSTAVHEDDGNKQLHNALVLHALEAPSKIMQAMEKHNGKADPKDRSVPEPIDTGEQTKICPNVTFTSAHNGQVLGPRTQNTGVMLNNLQSGHQASSKAEDPVQTVVYKRRNKSLNQHSLGEYTIWKQAEAVKENCKTEDKECAGSCLPSDMEVDEPSAVACSVDRECRSSSSTGDVRLTNGMKRLPSPTTVAVKESVGVQNDAEKSGENICSKHKAVSLNQYKVHDQALVPFGSNPKGFDKVHEVISSKGNLLSQAALRVVHRKRDMLCHQLRIIEDEIALCDRNVQTILSGGEDSLAVALDAVIEACSGASLCDDVPAHDATHQQVQDQNSFEYPKRRRICKASLSMQNPHQEL